MALISDYISAKTPQDQFDLIIDNFSEIQTIIDDEKEQLPKEIMGTIQAQIVEENRERGVSIQRFEIDDQVSIEATMNLELAEAFQMGYLPHDSFRYLKDRQEYDQKIHTVWQIQKDYSFIREMIGKQRDGVIVLHMLDSNKKPADLVDVYNLCPNTISQIKRRTLKYVRENFVGNREFARGNKTHS